MGTTLNNQKNLTQSLVSGLSFFGTLTVSNHHVSSNLHKWFVTCGNRRFSATWKCVKTLLSLKFIIMMLVMPVNINY